MPSAVTHTNAFVTAWEFPEDPGTVTFTDKRIKYAQWQLEKCPDTGRLHVHYGIWCTRDVARSVFQKWVGDKTANVQNIHNTDGTLKYTMKEESRIAGPWSYGDKASIESKQGKRTDLQQFVEDCKTMSYTTLIHEKTEMYSRYRNLAKDIKTYCAPHRALGKRCEVIVVWGPTTTGKTTKAYEIAESMVGQDFYVKDSSEKYWDGYDGQKVAIIEDFDPVVDETKITDWLKLTDGRRSRIRVMHGFNQNYVETFIFTANTDPKTWWSKSPNHEAWKKRITRIEVLETPVDELSAPPGPSGGSPPAGTPEGTQESFALPSVHAGYAGSSGDHDRLEWLD